MSRHLIFVFQWTASDAFEFHFHFVCTPQLHLTLTIVVCNAMPTPKRIRELIYFCRRTRAPSKQISILFMLVRCDRHETQFSFLFSFRLCATNPSIQVNTLHSTHSFFLVFSLFLIRSLWQCLITARWRSSLTFGCFTMKRLWHDVHRGVDVWKCNAEEYCCCCCCRYPVTELDSVCSPVTLSLHFVGRA